MDKSVYLATSGQRPVHEMYAIQHKIVLGTNTITKQYHCYNTNNCKYMPGCNKSN